MASAGGAGATGGKPKKTVTLSAYVKGTGGNILKQRVYNGYYNTRGAAPAAAAALAPAAAPPRTSTLPPDASGGNRTVFDGAPCTYFETLNDGWSLFTSYLKVFQHFQGLGAAQSAAAARQLAFIFSYVADRHDYRRNSPYNITKMIFQRYYAQVMTYDADGNEIAFYSRDALGNKSPIRAFPSEELAAPGSNFIKVEDEHRKPIDLDEYLDGIYTLSTSIPVPQEIGTSHILAILFRIFAPNVSYNVWFKKPDGTYEKSTETWENYVSPDASGAISILHDVESDHYNACVYMAVEATTPNPIVEWFRRSQGSGAVPKRTIIDRARDLGIIDREMYRAVLRGPIITPIEEKELGGDRCTHFDVSDNGWSLYAAYLKVFENFQDIGITEPRDYARELAFILAHMTTPEIDRSIEQEIVDRGIGVYTSSGAEKYSTSIITGKIREVAIASSYIYAERSGDDYVLVGAEKRVPIRNVSEYRDALYKRLSDSDSTPKLFGDWRFIGPLLQAFAPNVSYDVWIKGADGTYTKSTAPEHTYESTDTTAGKINFMKDREQYSACVSQAIPWSKDDPLYTWFGHNKNLRYTTRYSNILEEAVSEGIMSLSLVNEIRQKFKTPPDYGARASASTASAVAAPAPAPAPLLTASGAPATAPDAHPLLVDAARHVEAAARTLRSMPSAHAPAPAPVTPMALASSTTGGAPAAAAAAPVAGAGGTPAAAAAPGAGVGGAPAAAAAVPVVVAVPAPAPVAGAGRAPGGAPAAAAAAPVVVAVPAPAPVAGAGRAPGRAPAPAPAPGVGAGGAPAVAPPGLSGEGCTYIDISNDGWCFYSSYLKAFEVFHGISSDEAAVTARQLAFILAHSTDAGIREGIREEIQERGDYVLKDVGGRTVQQYLPSVGGAPPEPKRGFASQVPADAGDEYILVDGIHRVPILDEVAYLNSMQTPYATIDRSIRGPIAWGDFSCLKNTLKRFAPNVSYDLWIKQPPSTDYEKVTAEDNEYIAVEDDAKISLLHNGIHYDVCVHRTIPRVNPIEDWFKKYKGYRIDASGTTILQKALSSGVINGSMYTRIFNAPPVAVAAAAAAAPLVLESPEGYGELPAPAPAVRTPPPRERRNVNDYVSCTVETNPPRTSIFQIQRRYYAPDGRTVLLQGIDEHNELRTYGETLCSDSTAEAFAAAGGVPPAPAPAAVAGAGAAAPAATVGAGGAPPAPAPAPAAVAGAGAAAPAATAGAGAGGVLSAAAGHIVSAATALTTTAAGTGGGGGAAGTGGGGAAPVAAGTGGGGAAPVAAGAAGTGGGGAAPVAAGTGGGAAPVAAGTGGGAAGAGAAGTGGGAAAAAAPVTATTLLAQAAGIVVGAASTLTAPRTPIPVRHTPAARTGGAGAGPGPVPPKDNRIPRPTHIPRWAAWILFEDDITAECKDQTFITPDCIPKRMYDDVMTAQDYINNNVLTRANAIVSEYLAEADAIAVGADVPANITTMLAKNAAWARLLAKYPDHDIQIRKADGTVVTKKITNPYRAYEYRARGAVDASGGSGAGAVSFADPTGTRPTNPYEQRMFDQNVNVLTELLPHSEMLEDRGFGVALLESLWFCGQKHELRDNEKCFPARILGELREYQMFKDQKDRAALAREALKSARFDMVMSILDTLRAGVVAASAPIVASLEARAAREAERRAAEAAEAARRAAEEAERLARADARRAADAAAAASASATRVSARGATGATGGIAVATGGVAVVGTGAGATGGVAIAGAGAAGAKGHRLIPLIPLAGWGAPPPT